MLKISIIPDCMSHL